MAAKVAAAEGCLRSWRHMLPIKYSALHDEWKAISMQQLHVNHPSNVRIKQLLYGTVAILFSNELISIVQEQSEDFQSIVLSAGNGVVIFLCRSV